MNFRKVLSSSFLARLNGSPVQATVIDCRRATSSHINVLTHARQRSVVGTHHNACLLMVRITATFIATACSTTPLAFYLCLNCLLVVEWANGLVVIIAGIEIILV